MQSPTAIALGVLTTLLLAPAPAAAQVADDLFNGQALQRLDLLIHSSDWAKLKANFQENEYYPADLVWNGQTARNVGIRSRGRGSRSGTKPGLRVDFNRYVTDQEFLGLKSLVLDNLTQDASGIHETVATAFYARLGIPASREAHARLYVNDEYAGLYAMVESVDKDMLARVFGTIGDDTQNDGYLYEFKYQDEWRFENLGSSLDPYKLRFEPTTHETGSDEALYRPIETLVRLTHETPVSALVETVGSRFDFAGFIRFVAAQNFLAETDGFLGTWGMNNFYLYRLENQDQHVLIAWDADNTFWGATFPTNEGHATNALMAKVLSVPEYAALYATELRRAADLAAADGWLDTEIIRQVQLTDTALDEDPVQPHSQAARDGAVGTMLGFANARIAFVKCELDQGVRTCG